MIRTKWCGCKLSQEIMYLKSSYYNLYHHILSYTAATYYISIPTSKVMYMFHKKFKWVLKITHTYCRWQEKQNILIRYTIMGKFSYPLNLVNRKSCVFRLEADEEQKKKLISLFLLLLFLSFFVSNSSLTHWMYTKFIQYIKFHKTEQVKVFFVFWWNFLFGLSSHFLIGCVQYLYVP